jgi:Xaa-Pro aminopeptidase
MEETDIYENRLKKVEDILAERGIGCLLLNQTQSIEFLTGANNTCSWVFITKDGKRIALVLESDYRIYQKQTFIKDIRTFTPHDPLVHFRRIPDELGLGDREIALEKDHLKYSQYEMIEKTIGTKINATVNADHIVQEARIIKTPVEIELIKNASQLACHGIQIARETACHGMTEAQLAYKILEAMLDEGAGHGTYIYLASDERSSLAHNHPTNSRLEAGPVVIDIHSSYKGYHADMARTLFLEGSSPEQVRMYEFFRDRVLATIHSLKDGHSLLEAKRTFYRGLKESDDLILLRGPLLHGVGIVNYELPKFDHPFEGKGFPDKLMEGMALACTNIGLSSKQGWGIRYEDTFVIKRDGVDILTQD